MGKPLAFRSSLISCSVGQPDGVIGPRSEKAIDEWQTSHGHVATGALTNRQVEELLVGRLDKIFRQALSLPDKAKDEFYLDFPCYDLRQLSAKIFCPSPKSRYQSFQPFRLVFVMVRDAPENVSNVVLYPSTKSWPSFMIPRYN